MARQVRMTLRAEAWPRQVFCGISASSILLDARLAQEVIVLSLMNGKDKTTLWIVVALSMSKDAAQLKFRGRANDPCSEFHAANGPTS